MTFSSLEPDANTVIDRWISKTGITITAEQRTELIDMMILKMAEIAARHFNGGLIDSYRSFR